MPLCVQGSNVVYNDAPEQFFNFLSALNSACGLPFCEVTPEEITASFLTTIEPTAGFKPVLPKFFSACWKARSR